MDSYRAEAYGLLSITTLVTLLMQYMTNTFAPIELLYDNNALVTKIEKLRKSTRPEFPNDTLAPSWDVLQRITKNLRKFPEESSLQWIPSHQDDKTPIEQLPPDARLNVRADRLAGEFQQQSPHHQHDCTGDKSREGEKFNKARIPQQHPGIKLRHLSESSQESPTVPGRIQPPVDPESSR
jgi:hypothetical protein